MRTLNERGANFRRVVVGNSSKKEKIDYWNGLFYVAAAVLMASVHPLFASVMYCNRRSLVFYDIIILLVIILLVIILLLSVMMNGCGFSHWSYQVFHLPYLRGNWRCAFAATASPLFVVRLCASTIYFNATVLARQSP
jgi:hypothetical protein